MNSPPLTGSSFDELVLPPPAMPLADDERNTCSSEQESLANLFGTEAFTLSPIPVPETPKRTSLPMKRRIDRGRSILRALKRAKRDATVQRKHAETESRTQRRLHRHLQKKRTVPLRSAIETDLPRFIQQESGKTSKIDVSTVLPQLPAILPRLLPNLPNVTGDFVHVQSAMEEARLASDETLDTSMLPIAAKRQLPLNALQLPAEAWSFCGRFCVVLLPLPDATGRVSQFVVRFVYCPPGYKNLLMGPRGILDPAESFLFPSLGQASHLCMFSARNGWHNFYVLVVHGERTYRCALSHFRESSDGPGFALRYGFAYSPNEIERIRKESTATGEKTKQLLDLIFLQNHTNMGKHGARSFIPQLMLPLMRLVPTAINPNPTEPCEFGGSLRYPISRNSAPLFVQFTN
jgi:hypothetical protein